MAISLKKLQEEGKLEEIKFKESMTPGQLDRWLKFTKCVVSSYTLVKELEEESKEFLAMWKKVKNYDGPKKTETSWDQQYWMSCVELDFHFITLREKYTKLQAEGKIARS